MWKTFHVCLHDSKNLKLSVSAVALWMYLIDNISSKKFEMVDALTKIEIVFLF